MRRGLTVESVGYFFRLVLPPDVEDPWLLPELLPLVRLLLPLVRVLLPLVRVLPPLRSRSSSLSRPPWEPPPPIVRSAMPTSV